MKKKDIFIERVCGNVKYRSVRSKIEGVLLAQKEDFFSETADNADKLIEDINKYHHMPFNCKYGLIIWAAIATAFIYVIYPVLHKISNGSFNIPYNSLLLIGIILFMGLANYLILRKGHFIFSFTDILDITMGFLMGAILSVSILYVISPIEKYGYYPYSDDVKIPLFNSVRFFGTEMRTFGNEFMIWFFCILIYISSIKIKSKENRFSFVTNLDASGVYRIDIDDNFYK